MKNFTLIELVVVVVVMGILAVIVIPNVSGMNKEANEVALKGNVKSVENATDLFVIDNGYYPVEGKVAEIKSAEGELIDLNQLVPKYLHEKPKGEFYINPTGNVAMEKVEDLDDAGGDDFASSETSKDKPPVIPEGNGGSGGGITSGGSGSTGGGSTGGGSGSTGGGSTGGGSGSTGGGSTGGGGGWSGGGGSWTGGGNCSDDKWSNVSGCADRPGTGTSTH